MDVPTSLIVNAIDDSIIGVDTQGLVCSINSATSRTFGYDADEIVGRDAGLLLASHISHDDLLEQFNLEEAGSQGQVETEGQRKDGTVFPVEATICRTEVNGESLFVEQLRDVTDTKKQQCELNQSHKLESIGRLAAGIAHEINTPTQYVGDNLRFLETACNDILGLVGVHDRVLQAVKAAGDLEDLVNEAELATKEADLEFLLQEIPDAVQQALEGTHRVATIVRAMKEFSYPSRSHSDMIDLNKAIETTITVARNEWKYVADLETDFDTDLSQTRCFPADLNQAVLNLIINAADAISECRKDEGAPKGKISVRTRQSGDRVVIEVADSGPGIPDEIRSRIFDPFFTTKSIGKGTGQGLAIVRSVIVDKHHGSIEVESDSAGTTFILKLPRQPGDDSEGT